jgi:hypothetical protein
LWDKVGVIEAVLRFWQTNPKAAILLYQMQATEEVKKRRHDHKAFNWIGKR